VNEKGKSAKFRKRGKGKESLLRKRSREGKTVCDLERKETSLVKSEE